MELLFPAGSKEHVKVAIDKKVSAVYGGFKKWNARDKANNFDIDEYKSILNELHSHNIKFYLTLNTLMFDNEINEIIDIFKTIPLPDAFIVADLGLISKLHKYFPDTPIHLSTQFGIHNSEDTKLADYIGASRVILARELTEDEIRNVSKNTKLETECFIYGSQCISYSGQCYFSSLLNGGSGNRGKCEIFCRDTYQVKDKIGSLLYVPDLNCSDMINKLPNIDCWKLEGRKRNPHEVGKYIDSLGKKTEQNGYAYGTNLSQNHLFNLKHKRSQPLLYSANYDLNGNNISLDINIKDGNVIKIVYIDNQGQGTNFYNDSVNMMTISVYELVKLIESAINQKIYKVSSNLQTEFVNISRNTINNIIHYIKEHSENTAVHNSDIEHIDYIEIDNLGTLLELKRKYPQYTYIYNIGNISNLLRLEPIDDFIIYKLPIFNFEDIRLDRKYHKFSDKRVMLTHVGQLAGLEYYPIKERIVDYTIPVWNKETIELLKKYDINSFTASPELTPTQNEQIFGKNSYNYIITGKLPLSFTRMKFNHLFDNTSEGIIHNVDKNLDFEIKDYQDYRVILPDRPMHNIVPNKSNIKTRFIASGMNISDIETYIQTGKLLKQFISNNTVKRK